jgi:hypothetical protein
MKERFGKLALSLLIIVNVSALLTFAYNRWVRQPGGAPSSNSVLADAFKRQLCLSGRQEKCIQDFRFAFDSEIRDIQARMREKRRAMIEELKKEPPDGPTLDKLIEDMSRLQAEIQKKAVADLLKEKEVLTDEQKAKFFRLFEDHVCPREKGSDRDSAAAGQAGCPREIER